MGNGPSDREVVSEVISKTVRKLGQQARQDNASALTALRKQGIGFVSPPTEMLAEWKKKVSKAMDQLGERSYFSQDTLRVFRGHLKENGGARSLAAYLKNVQLQLFRQAKKVIRTEN